jgi:N-acyl-D-aspartate/D-glutamate deacylase
VSFDTVIRNGRWFDRAGAPSAEHIRMECMLDEALRAGFVGMSSQQLLFDKLDGVACRSRTLRSTYAKRTGSFLRANATTPAAV